ncbi:amidase [Alkalilimnicola sp. S0819]|uniref:amidase n=1 Tax=Alkalilimnicola sp. S0819 TaxID=2613922 RepID=UPI001261533E|nr:amidase [Alkalilimnicola sp. S0819]KAB7623726.1 amidase [Alkalilimnicola sp. S0819]MPQ16855.1 amidase [Alkalilimnicola sp. S0819]
MTQQQTRIADLSALELLRLFRGGELSPVEAARACLARIERHNPAVNAYCLIDPDTTLAAARDAEQRYRRGEPLGLVDGVPTAIKDVFYTRGWRNLKGSRTVDSEQPWDTDAPAVAALRRHGFVPLGKTTTPEFGWKGVTDSPLCGPTNNPWDPSKTAGGSSGGSGAAVMLGMGPLSLGTDAGGSIRIPAGFCGCVGHKPTHGRVPMWPPSPFAPLAHPGPMTRTVEDAALLMNVISEPDPRDSTLPDNRTDFLAVLGEGVRGLRIAYSPDFGYVRVDREIHDSVAAAAALFQELGAVVEHVDPGFTDPLESFGRLFYGGAANALRDLDEAKRALMDPGLISVAKEASRLSMLDYLAAMNERAALIERMSLFHTEYDLLLSPSLPIPAFDANREVPAGWPHERWPTWTPFTYPFNMTGQPACSVPCGFTRDGLPIGLQLVGARHRDDLVLRAAHAYQQANPLHHRRPPLLQE